jgi:hypothetical protein
MRITNNDNSERSYFVYNYEDTHQGWPLVSGPIKPHADWDWTPPDNGSGSYTVLIKRDPSGGSIMAGGSGGKNATFVFNGYTLVVS